MGKSDVRPAQGVKSAELLARLGLEETGKVGRAIEVARPCLWDAARRIQI